MRTCTLHGKEYFSDCPDCNTATRFDRIYNEIALLNGEIIALRGLRIDDAKAFKARIEDLENLSHQTVFFPCGCVFKQDGLDAEPLLIKHCDGTVKKEN